MKILALATFVNDSKEYKLEHFCAKLDDFYFFQRETIREYCIFGMKTLVERMGDNVKMTMNGEKDFKVAAMFHILQINSRFACAITDAEYPPRVGFSLLGKIIDDSKNTNIDEYLKSYQNPAKADKLTKIQHELDEVKTIMVDNIEQVLQRGEKLDSLVAKSQDLSKNAKIFRRQAKNVNSCCKSW